MRQIKGMSIVTAETLQDLCWNILLVTLMHVSFGMKQEAGSLSTFNFAVNGL